jgi:hypothetical protein
MADYIFAYHGGKIPETPEEGAKVMEQWGAWMEKTGEAMVNPGNPAGMSKTVSSGGVTNDGGANPISGFSVVKANSIEAAIEIARTCPHLTYEGTIEVAELLEM